MIDERGDPASWRHYRYGLDRLGRADAEHSARIGGAMRAAQSKETDYEAWRRKQRSVGGW